MVRVLRKIGLDQVSGFFSVSEVREAGLATESYESVAPGELASRIESGELKLIDVRSNEEWTAGHIAAADHHFLGRLPENMSAIDTGQRIVTQCQGGDRSAIAASVLQAAGIDVINMTGGIGAWSEARLSVDTPGATATCDAGARQCI